MSELRAHYTAMVAAWNNPLHVFMADNGRDYHISPRSFKGRRMAKQQCYRNATLLASENRSLTYVEGTMGMYGVPIDHAWVVNEDGVVFDPTVRKGLNDGTFDRVGPYYGVPFRTDYVLKATLVNGVYGLLDGFYARKTLYKLIELGLEEGQQWLMDNREMKYA